MCFHCRKCKRKLIPFEYASTVVKTKLNPENKPDAYEYCCVCPNGCPDQRPPPDNQDKCEMCCDCA